MARRPEAASGCSWASVIAAEPAERDAHEPQSAIAARPCRPHHVLPQALGDHALVVVGEVRVHREHVRVEPGRRAAARKPRCSKSSARSPRPGRKTTRSPVATPAPGYAIVRRGTTAARGIHQQEAKSAADARQSPELAPAQARARWPPTAGRRPPGRPGRGRARRGRRPVRSASRALEPSCRRRMSPAARPLSRRAATLDASACDGVEARAASRTPAAGQAGQNAVEPGVADPDRGAEQARGPSGGGGDRVLGGADLALHGGGAVEPESVRMAERVVLDPVAAAVDLRDEVRMRDDLAADAEEGGAGARGGRADPARPASPPDVGRRRR